MSIFRSLTSGLFACVMMPGILLVLGPGASQAQTVSFDVPQEVRVEPGLLSVVFADGISEVMALDWLREAGFEASRVSFSEVVAHVKSSEPFPEAQVNRLREHPDVTEVTLVQQDASPWTLLARFAPHRSAEEVRVRIQEAIGLAPYQVTKIPNDIEVRVPEGEEEMALEAIQAGSAVAYVTYVAAIE